MSADLEFGAIVLVGDHNWRKGPIWRAALAFCFGRRQRFEHLSMKCTVAWFQDSPFLIGIREVKQ